MFRNSTHKPRSPRAGSARRLPLVALAALSLAGSSLAGAPAAVAQPVGPSKTVTVTCDGFPVGSQRITKVTIRMKTGSLVVKETVEECGADGYWGPKPA